MTTQPTIAQAVSVARARFARAGIASAALDARLLVAYALNVSVAHTLAERDRPLDPRQAAAIAAVVTRRCAREPLAYITGHREFWSLNFRVTPATLIPRPESETVVETAVRLCPTTAPLILDLGTGSGCLLLSLLHTWPDAHGIGVDRSAAALAVARSNAVALGLGPRARFVCADWTTGVHGRFDLIVCNPPYVAATDYRGLAPEITAFEPAGALLAGDDGLEAYGRLAPGLLSLLAPGGLALLEIGAGQAPAVEALLCAQGLHRAGAFRDLGGICRVLAARGEMLVQKKLGTQPVPDYC